MLLIILYRCDFCIHDGFEARQWSVRLLFPLPLQWPGAVSYDHVAFGRDDGVFSVFTC
jgi:hypothetical protein